VGRTLVLVVLGLAATGCLGGSQSHSATHPTSTATAPVQLAQKPRPHGSQDIEAPDFLHATMPASWYGQTYATTNIIITSFPIHTVKQAYRPIPPGGVAVSIFDMPPATKAGCRLHPHLHGRLRLGGYEPNYDGFGAAYRIEFYDHGHHTLVFVAFGGPALPDIRRLAVGVLNSIHADVHACPIPPLRL